MEHKEIPRGKFEVHIMKESSEKAMEVNIDKHKDDKTFKVKSDIYDSGEV